MGQTILVSEVLEECRVRLGSPPFTSNTAITSAAALNMIKFSARRLGALVRRAFGSDYFCKPGTIATQAGLNMVSLPADFSDLRQIAWVRDDGISIPLELASVDQWLAQGEEPVSWSCAPVYRLMGNTIQFFPCPSDVYTLSIYYDGGIYVTATTDVFVIQPGWEEWLINDFCVKYRQFENKDSTDYQRERAIAQEAILVEAAQRDRFKTFEVRDLWSDGNVIDSRSLWWQR